MPQPSNRRLATEAYVDTAKGTGLQKTANLSDVASAATARSNLGLGTAATQPDTAFVSKWKASTAYTAGDPVLNPSGQIVTANTSFTSGATYNASNWTVVSGGGAVSSVAGRTGAVTLASTDLTDSTATGQALVSAATAAAARTTLGLGSAATQPSSAFDAAGAAAAAQAFAIAMGVAL